MTSGTASTFSGKDLHSLRGTLDPIPVGVILFDPRGRPLVANRAARDLLGDVASLPVGGWAEAGCFVLPNGEKAGPLDLPPCQTLCDGLLREEVELSFRPEPEVSIPLLVASRAVRDCEGDVVQVACSLTTIAEHRRRGEQSALEQRYDAVSSLVAGVAGPLNDALTAITGYCDLACGGIDDSNPLKGVVEEIRQAGERAAVLSGRLMSHGRREVPVLEILDLDRWLASHVTTLHSLLGDGISLEIAPAAEGARVKVDDRLLHQMLADLLTNAREAMPNGGRVTITTSPVKIDPVVARLMGEPEDAAYLALTVHDAGGGMSEPVLRRIFEPFFTTKPGALGVGLATVERLARIQGGSVRVENHRGEGASFHIHLLRAAPQAAESVPAPGSLDDAEVDVLTDALVLLVEDDVVVRDLVRQVLEMRGCRVIEARGGADATRVLDQLEGAPPDLLVSDVVMPGEGGPALAARLRRRHPELQVLLMSGCNDAALLASTLASEEIAFLPKPFNPDGLIARVRTLLAHRAVADAPSDVEANVDAEPIPNPHPNGDVTPHPYA